MIAVDMDTGRVNWAYWAHKYDAWNQACGAPDLYGWSPGVPAAFPAPRAPGSRNNGRDSRTPYVPVTRFLDCNGFTALGLKTGPFVKSDAAPPSEYPSPSNIDLPFPGPNIIYGITDYPNDFPDDFVHCTPVIGH